MTFVVFRTKKIFSAHSSICLDIGKRIAPLFEQLAKENTGIKFVKIDVDECPTTAEECEVTAMPTFHVYVKGEKKKEMLGADETKLKQMIADLNK